MEKRRTQYFKYLFHIILQMLPIPLHGDLVPNEMKLWNRSERFFFCRRSQTSSSRPYPSAENVDGRTRRTAVIRVQCLSDRDWQVSDNSAKTRRHVFFFLQMARLVLKTT